MAPPVGSKKKAKKKIVCKDVEKPLVYVNDMTGLLYYAHM